MPYKVKIITLLLIIMLVALAACALAAGPTPIPGATPTGPAPPTPEPTPADPGAPPPLDPALAGQTWQLVALNGQEVVPGTEVTLLFSVDQQTGQVGGSAGCNSYGSEFTAAAGGNLEIGEIVSTLILCMEPEGIMDQEAAFLEALRTAAAYEVTADRLEIMDQTGQTTLVFEAAA